MSGRVGNLSPKQAEALEVFRKTVEDLLLPGHDDHHLLRWLRARNFDVKKTEAMYRKSMEWRKHNNIDTLVDDYQPSDFLQKYVTSGRCGFDKEGSPILVDPIGRLDPHGLLRSVKKSDVLKCKLHQLEVTIKIMKEQSKKLERNIESEVIIYDLDKLGTRHLWKPGMTLYTELVKLVEDNYPERLKLIFILNAPIIFPIVWQIVKPFLDEGTVNKVKVFGKSNYQSKLLQYIDADQLPAVYGGTLVGEDGDPRCSNLISQGGEVPKQFYFNINDIDKSNFKEKVIGRSSTFEEELNVKHTGSVLSWQFITEGYDLGFGVYRRTKPGPQKVTEMEPIVQSQRKNSHLVPEDGCIVCDTVGTYVLLFDNSYSLTRSKKLLYTVDLVENDGTEIDASFENIKLTTEF